MRKKFLILWLAGVVSTALALPYIFALQRDVLTNIPMPLWQVALISITQTAILLAVAAFLGLKLAQKINLPILTKLSSGTSFGQNFIVIAKLAVPLGFVTGSIIKLGDLFFIKYTPELQTVLNTIPVWKILLVSFYGGIVEEILLRLFVVTLFAWILSKIFRITDILHNNPLMWIAIVAAAIIFGLGHLPVTATITDLTPIVIARAIALNGIGGFVFGWLYWKKGLEYAILSHFTADITLLVILPFFLG